jgi:hypothetical protein
MAMAGLMVNAAGQERPNFSGRWIASQQAPAGMPAAPSPVFGPRFAIEQSGSTLTLVRPQREGASTITFMLDGREARMRVTGPLCQADAESIETAAWEGEALAHTVVGLVMPAGGEVSPRSVKRVFRKLGSDTIVVEATMVQAGQRRQVATVYTRTTDSMPAITAAPPSGPAATISQVAWIGGVWTGTAGQATVEERWTPPAGGSMIGVGRTLRNTVMAGFEFLCFTERGGTLVYSAMPNGRSPATHFTLSSITADTATFENPSHDFPQVIRYARRADGSLETTISALGGAKAQSFVLIKKE